MDTAIVAALITTFGVLISTLLVIFKDHLAGLFSHRKRKWAGVWTGAAHSDQTDVTYEVTIKLKQTGRVISGTMMSHSPETLEYRVKGKIQEPEFMSFYAYNTDSETINYIVGILRLPRAADKIIGVYLARSRIVEEISSGQIECSRPAKGSPLR